MAIVGLALAYSLTINVLSMFEGTMCLRLVGGQGCGVNVTAANATDCSPEPA